MILQLKVAVCFNNVIVLQVNLLFPELLNPCL